MNFIFEDDFDFKKELEEMEPVGSTCLITGTPLFDECTLNCNHSYNYDSIFTEVYNQKINPKFKNDIFLKDNELKCPYCRKIQRGLLPEREKIFRVTTINKDYAIDPNIVPTVECLKKFKAGICAMPTCSKKQVTFIKRLNEHVCCFHIKIPKTQLMRHIKLHKYLLKYPNTDIPYFALWEDIKKEEADEKLKAKADAKQAKDQAKADAKQAKDQAKADAKQAKDQAKADAKQAKAEAKQAKDQAKDQAKADAKTIHLIAS